MILKSIHLESTGQNHIGKIETASALIYDGKYEGPKNPVNGTIKQYEVFYHPNKNRYYRIKKWLNNHQDVVLIPINIDKLTRA